MPIPVMRQADSVIAIIQSAVSDEEWVELHRAMAERVRERRSRSVVIDVSALDVLDSFATRMLRSIGLTARLAGARTVICGIAPDVAYAMVQLGLTLDELDTALDLDQGLTGVHRGSAGNRPRPG
jgi:rsbT antagonist protein RsbS